MKKKVFSLFLCALLAVTSLVACKGSSDGEGKAPAKELTRVTLNEVAHSIFYAPQYVAIEEGYFAEEGIDLELVTGFGVI